MQEILLSLGGLLIVQIGLTIRKWISERRNSKSDESIKKDLLNIIADLKAETSLFKEQIEKLTKQLSKSESEYKILFKHYKGLEDSYAALKLEVKKLTTFAKHSSQLKKFDSKMTRSALDLINKKSRKTNNEKLKSFLETSSRSAIKIFINILACQLDNIDVDLIQSDFDQREDYLRIAFACDEMNVNKDEIESIIYTEIEKFIENVKNIPDLKEDERCDQFTKLCDVFLLNTITEIRNL